MGEKIDPGRAWLGEKIDQLVVYTSLFKGYVISIWQYSFSNSFLLGRFTNRNKNRIGTSVGVAVRHRLGN